MIDIIGVIIYMVSMTFYTFFGRYFLEFLIPKERRYYYDKLTRQFRLGIISFLSEFMKTTITPGDRTPRYNLEVILLSRFFVPFVLLSYIHANVYLILTRYVYGQLLFTTLFLFLFDVYLFLNIAPSVEDFAYLHDSVGFKPYVLKISFLFSIYNLISPLLTIFLLLFPITIFDIPLKFKNFRIMSNSKSISNEQATKVGQI